jgi:hypothetical protein
MKPFIIIEPKNYIPSGKVIWHYHGLRRASWDIDKDDTPNGFGTISYFKFEDYLPQDTLMVCPVGRITNYSLENTFGSVKQVIPILNEISKYTKETYLQVTISGHSAGGRCVRSILNGGTGMLPVNRAFLFDALYMTEDVDSVKTLLQPYNIWINKKADRSLFSVAREDNDLYARQKQIKSTVGKCVTLLSEEPDHWKLVKKYFPIFLKG